MPNGGQKLGYHPLVFSVSGVEPDEDALANARTGALPRMVSAGAHVNVETDAPTLTGTSTSTAALAGAAAQLWSRFPTLDAPTVMAYLYDTGLPLGFDSNYQLGIAAQPVRQLDVCEAMTKACGDTPGCAAQLTCEGVDGLLPHVLADGVQIAFDATSAYVHAENSRKLNALGVLMIDLTPAAIGPFCVPPVNLKQHVGQREMNVNMVTCGGQATIPMVAAISRVQPVSYGEIVATVSSKSAGPGTRKNIDEFTRTTAGAVEKVGGAKKGKAIIIINPAEPPLIMRDTVYCLCEDADQEAIRKSVEDMVAEVQTYVPGYRLKQAVQFERIGSNRPLRIPEMDAEYTGLKVSVFLEVEGAAHYLPAYAGNLDILTSAALRTAEKIDARMHEGAPA